MVTLQQVLATSLACALLVVVPGPSVLFIVGRALSQGRRVAVASVAGNSLGCYAAAIAVAVGLGPVLQRSDLLFTFLKFAGAAYLVWLGLQAIRSSRASSLPGAELAHEDRTWRAIRAGFVVGVTNPKSLVPVLLGFVTDALWGLAAGRARTWLSSTPGRARAVARVGGASMVGLGVSIAL